MSFTDELINCREWTKLQRERIMELEVALNVAARTLTQSHAYVTGDTTDAAEIENAIRFVLVRYILPELGKSNAAEFGPMAEPSTTEQGIYDALGMGKTI